MSSSRVRWWPLAGRIAEGGRSQKRALDEKDARTESRRRRKRTGCSSLRVEGDSSSFVTVDVRSEVAAVTRKRKEGSVSERKRRTRRSSRTKGSSQDGVRRLSQPSPESQLVAEGSG